MRNALLALVLVLLAGSGIGWLAWHERSAVARADGLKTQLDTALDANKQLGATLDQVQKDRAEDQRQVQELSDQLEQIRNKQQATKSSVAKVVKDASPSDQDLLSRKLPAAVLRLLPSGPGAGDHDPSGAAESAG